MVKYLNNELTRPQQAQYEKIFTMIIDAKPISEIETEWKFFVEDITRLLPPGSHFSKTEHMEALDEIIENLEEQLASTGDDAQLANIDLQSELQKQQQTIQTMTNVSKMMHDTAMALIRKIG